MKVVFLAEAERELGEILETVAKDSLRGASNIAQRVDSILGSIADQPMIGRRTNRPNVYRFPVTPFPYILFYRVAQNTVEVLAIRHAARDPRTMPDAPGPEN